MRKKISKKIMAIAIATIMLVSYFLPLTSVIANAYGTGTNFIKVGIDNKNTGFTLINATVNGDPWTGEGDEYHSNNDTYNIVISVSKDGDRIPDIQYGGNWSGQIQKNYTVTDDTYTYTLNLNNSNHQEFLGLSIIEKMENNGVEPGPEPGESYFDGKAYVVWSCGTGTCYHYFDNIPAFDDGNSTFYKATNVKADNDSTISFDVKANRKDWILKEDFERWENSYKAKYHVEEINWANVDPEDIIGEPPDMREWEEKAITSGTCVRPPEDAPGNERENFERCVDKYAEEQSGMLPFVKLQPVGEPSYTNAYVSYGDRNFKVVIYNNEYKGVTMGDLSKLSYYPAEWTNAFIRRDQFDISGSTKNKPAQLNSILLESTVRIKALDYNGFEIASIEPLDVPEDAVTVTKENKEFKLEYSSNFYDEVVFKVTDTKGGVSYMQIKRYTIDGWIKFVDNHPVLTADFYFDREKSYKDFDLTAKIIYKDGTSRNVTLTASYGIDDGLGNMTWDYEVDEEKTEYGEGGKGLKKSSFNCNLEDGEDRLIDRVYLNAEYKGSTEYNYAGAYVGSGEGVLANIYHEEEE